MCVFSHIFCSELPWAKELAASTNTTSITVSIHKNTTLIIPQLSDTTTQTQPNSYSDASVSAHDVASARLDQRTNHHGNTDAKDNDD